MDKEKLLNRVWFTKKARHNAESRLLRTENTLSFLLAYYSIFLVSSQIFPKFVVSAQNDSFDWFTTSSSLFILVFSLLISGQNYKIRAERMKNCYLELSDIEQGLEKGSNPDEMFDKYNQILKRYDNHSSIDYDSVNLWKKQHESESCETCIWRHVKVIGFRVMCWGGTLFLLISPLIIVSIYIYPHIKLS